MNADDLERLIAAELRRLPAPPAPRTLLPRVLAATVARRRSPWHDRRQSSSRPAWRVASVVGAPGVAVVSMLAWFWLRGLEGEPAALAALLGNLDRASALVRVSWRVLLQPLAFSVMAAAVVLSLGCAALWSVLNRFALGEVPES
jgi:hypothetical protein